MNRDLRFDAHQVSLGDDTLLTLELRAETPLKTLRQELGDSGSIHLLIDQLAKGGRTPLGFNFNYLVDKTTELLTLTATSNLNSPVFAQLVLVNDQFSLKSEDAIEVQWRVEEWQEEGAYILKGEVTPVLTSGPSKAASTNSSRSLDFGPEKLTVSDVAADTPQRVSLVGADRVETTDEGLWDLIKRRTLDFNKYRAFIDSVLCDQTSPANSQIVSAHGKTPFNRLASYAMLRHATELYLMQESGLAVTTTPATVKSVNMNLPAGRGGVGPRRLSAGAPERGLDRLREEYLEELEKQEGRVLPYFHLIRQKLSEVPLKTTGDLGGLGTDVCYGILKSKLEAPPLLELIWSYWHEEGGLVQTMNAISLRFQNVRQNGRGPDPLAGLNIDPLRPLSNLIWGYIEDERNRLTLNRRNLEYQYEYGIGLIGRAVQTIPVAEHRTFFLRGFHSLLRAAVEFYQQANFTTVIPDGFPVLNHLREVHLLLAEGAHNQYGDLPWTARSEMLVQQWLLARPEMREFLGGRVMVPYTEPWMDRVDNMKQLQGWNPANISHFHDLGTFGEQLLLSIRYGSWNSSATGASNAANWAHSWRHAIQRYIHAYKAVTGVDLASDIVDARLNMPDNEERYLQPAQLIERQSAMQQQQLRRNRQLSGPMTAPGLGQGLSGRVPLRRGGYLE